MIKSSCRILVVDDEAMVCESVRLLLAYDGHQVETASGGAEALAKLEAGTFDVVFTDFSMPGMKGDELAEKIKARDPRKPVILLTAFPPATQPKGVDLIITKPFYLATLRKGVEEALAKY
jgi:CheY-like chemotaxis protein